MATINKKYFAKFLSLILLNLSLNSCNSIEKFSGNQTEEFKVLDEELNVKKKEKQEYVTGSNDIPLFKGLKQIDDNNANFDTMVGSITISSYLGKNSDLEKIANFYQGSLPQLGWKLENNSKDNMKLSYKRIDENLEISFERKNKDELLVKFFISSSM